MTRSIQGLFFFGAVLMAACFSLCIPAVAQDTKEAHIIQLKNTRIAPIANARNWIDSMSKIASVKEPIQVLIHFENIPSQEHRAALQLSGITLYDYIPDNTFFALIHFPVNTELIGSLPIQSIIDAKPEWKADDYIWNKVAGNTNAVELLVSFYPGIDATMVKQFIAQVGGQVNPSPMEHYGAYKIIIAASKVRSMAQWYGVRYISPSNPMVPLDLQSMPAVKGNVASADPVYGGYGLLGDSVTVGVGDESSGIYHADTKDRVVNFNPSHITHHGGFVNGIVGGAANVDPLAMSITPHVTLIDHFFDVILPATGAMLHDYNMTITNNSYEVVAGDCGYSGTYDGYSQFLDSLSIQYPEVLHVFASGNDGWNTCSPYPPGYATIGGGYQPAKNTVVVGSMTDTLIEASDESRGPMKDGRLKPEIVAVGWLAYSDINYDTYSWSAGTSFAAPQVASGLAALTQRYKQLNGGTQPQNDLLKTILLNGALDVGNPGPDYSYGFGAMDLYRSLEILNNGHYYTGTINNSGTQSFNFIVPANTGQLKVMLYWNDVPANPSSAKQLVNDLDIVVTDPSGNPHLPLVLDNTPANVANNATEQADHLNNIEQVTITGPPTGTYTFNVKGFNIPQGPQRYVVAYDVLPKNMHLTFPLGGEQLSNTDNVRCFWDAVSDGNTFTVKFSQNNGGSWQTVATNVPANFRYCDFSAAGINSSDCLIQVSRNNTTDVVTSARFTINTQPVVNLDTAQCPGYVHIHWSPVPNASSYLLLKKTGSYMQVVDSVTDTTYIFAGMSLTEKSYVAVQPVINGVHGYRSVSAITIANTGNCVLPVSSGDLMIEKILAPSSGRLYTSNQLSPSAVMKVRLRNLYSSSCTNYSLSYRINSGSWQTLLTPGTIPANSTVDITTPLLSFPDTGVYNITVAVHNLSITDPQPQNDTTSFSIHNLPNDTVSLATPFFDGFETMPAFAVAHDSIGISPNNHWDYFNTDDSGRVRSFVDDQVTISGTRSVSLDENQRTLAGSNNTLVGTFNLANYDTANTEIRIDFDYVLHGTPKSPIGNLVTARGADTTAWVPFYTYDLNAYPATINHARSLSLTDVVRLSGHNFSTSTQVSFGQSDTSLIAAPNYGNGMTFDNFRLYTVTNDVVLLGVATPLPTNCGLSSSVPLTVRVHNGVNYTLHNVQLFYSMDSGTVYSGTIDSIRAKDTINYSFAQLLDIGSAPVHSLNIWLNAPGDSYLANDSILNYKFRNSTVISTYPYLENFEGGTAGYFTDGVNDSWQFGTPASTKIHKAASGTNAWKTNLTGKYNNLEKSYLYSPCFDIALLAHPMLSFSIASDIENCGGILCDAGYIEYSFDGAAWAKLGASGEGTNWYDAAYNVWNTQDFIRWHVASIPLPQPPVGQTIHFRFVMAADPGATFEGMAIDDIHIYDLAYPILQPAMNTTVLQNISGNEWVDFTQANQVLLSVQPNGQSINDVRANLYTHDTLSNPNVNQHILSRSYTLSAPQDPTWNIGVHLYLLDSDVINVLNDVNCPSCSPVTDAYSLGITQYYNHHNPSLQNGSLTDDTGGVFTFYPHTSVTWVPYDKGYYAGLSTTPWSELWFNNGGPTGVFPLNVDYLNFIAFNNGQNVTTYWYSLIDTVVNAYTLQRSADSVNFTTILDTIATHTNPGQYTFTDPVNITSSAPLYYRLQWTMPGNSNTYYSPIRKVVYTDTATNLITFNAQLVGRSKVHLNWASFIDGMVDHYVLDRAVGSGSYSTIYNAPSLHNYGQQYDFFDMPSVTIPSQAFVHYRLTAVLGNGTSVVLPIRTVGWDNGNSIADLYPNPNYDGKVTITWHADSGTVLHMRIYDDLGRNKYETSVTATQWSNTTTFQAFTHIKGVYFARFEIGGQRYTAKLVYE